MIDENSCRNDVTSSSSSRFCKYVGKVHAVGSIRELVKNINTNSKIIDAIT